MAKKIQVAFFKAMYGSVLSKTIKVVTNSEYSHVELIIGEHWYGSNINLLGESGITKVHKPKITPKEWKIIDINVTDKQYKEIKQTAEQLVGSGYSFVGAIKSQFSIFDVTTTDEFFCSQYVAYVLKKNKVLHFVKGKASKYDPGALLREMTNKVKYTKKDSRKLKFSELKTISFSLEEIQYRW